MLVAAMSAAMSAPAQTVWPRMVRPPKAFGYSVSLPGGGTEEIYLQTPWYHKVNRPLLLIFHGYAFNNRWDTLNPLNPGLNSQLEALLDEAAIRGWYAASLTGGPNLTIHNPPFALTYAGPELHLRTSAVIDEMIALYSINPDRIYTLGYSMGGIDAVNYAARHVDPEGHMIAASWCWSGTLCAEDSTPPCAQVPCTSFDRIAASVVQTDQCDCPNQTPSPSFVENESLGWNLEHIWLTTTTAANDICHVECPAPAMQALSAQWSVPGRHTHINNYGQTHNDPSNWNPKDICDFFAGKSVSLPTSATRTIVVEDAMRYFYFEILRMDPGQPGMFGWNFSLGGFPGQTLDIDHIDNLTAIWLDVDGGVDSPLVNNLDIAVNLTPEPTNLSGTHIILRGLTYDPAITVQLNGQVVAEGAKWDWLPPLFPTAIILYRQLGATSADWLIDLP